MTFLTTAGWLTVDQVHQITGIPHQDIYKAIHEGRIGPIKKEGRKYWIDPLFEYFDRQPTVREHKYTPPVKFDVTHLLEYRWHGKLKVTIRKGAE